MGNRGTTRSWDDEEIEKWGLAEFLRMTTAPFRAERARRDTKLVSENIEIVLALLPDASEETRARVVFAIPLVLDALSMVEHAPDLAMSAWRERIASEIYEERFYRLGQLGPRPGFTLLSEKEQKTFLEIIEAIAKAKPTPAATSL